MLKSNQLASKLFATITIVRYFIKVKQKYKAETKHHAQIDWIESVSKYDKNAKDVLTNSIVETHLYQKLNGY